MPAKVNPEKCDGIGACKAACPFDCFDMVENKKEIKSVVARPEDCVECGLCIDTCPVEAIEIE